MLMKNTLSFKPCLLFLSILFSLNAVAQDSPQRKLPEGASIRLGKGSLTGPVAYSPDGARLAVASSLGIWLYDTTNFQESALLNGHTAWIDSMEFSPNGLTLATGNGDTKPSICGMRQRERTRGHLRGIRVPPLAWRSARMV